MLMFLLRITVLQLDSCLYTLNQFHIRHGEIKGRTDCAFKKRAINMYASLVIFIIMDD
jgi:hypothetical protein